MSQTAPVTVVIPAYNAADYLGVTLEALQGQTTPPERVIVVDDGSIDGTIGVANSMGVEVVSQEQRGPGAARNRALEMADTEFVAFCDADDWFVSDKLERDVRKLDELGAACLASDAWIVRGDRVDGRKNEQRVVPSVITEEALLQVRELRKRGQQRLGRTHVEAGLRIGPALLLRQEFTGTEPVPTQRRIHQAAALLQLQSLSIMSLLLSQLAKKMQRRTMLRSERHRPLQQWFSSDPMALLPGPQARAVKTFYCCSLVHERRPMRALTCPTAKPITPPRTAPWSCQRECR